MSRIKTLQKKAQTAKSAFVVRHREELRRKHRQVIYFNDPEMAAIEEYCSRFQVRHRSALLRDAIMSRILEVLDQNPSSLF
ncbi:MAG: hypothetical protein J6X69_07460 [Bacteroidales bacterium]|nr:hypothetical protein [Bacteroidales bacterium]